MVSSNARHPETRASSPDDFGPFVMHQTHTVQKPNYMIHHRHITDTKFNQIVTPHILYFLEADWQPTKVGYPHLYVGQRPGVPVSLGTEVRSPGGFYRTEH